MDEIVERYFAAMLARDAGAAGALYADDAVFDLPNGQQHHGREAIRAMHAHVFAAGAPLPSPGARIVTPTAAAVEIAARLPDGSVRHTTNHFYLGPDGRLARISVYMKAPPG